MSVKRTRQIRSKMCECDKCGDVSVSIPGAPHRRCSGQKGAKPRDKYAEQLPSASAGKWT